MMKTAISRAITALALGGLVAGCTARPEPLEPVKLGLLIPETNFGDIAKDWKRAAVLASEQINAAGGLFDGRAVELVVEDTGADTNEAVDAMRQVLDEGVVGVVGPATSGESEATLPLAVNAETPQISCCATSTSLTDGQTNKQGWFFRTTAHDNFQAKALAYVASQGFRGPHPTYAAVSGATEGANINSCTHLAIIHQDDNYGDSLADALDLAYQNREIAYFNDAGDRVPRLDANGLQAVGKVIGRWRVPYNFVGARQASDSPVISEAQSYLNGTAAGYEDNPALRDVINSTYDFDVNAGICFALVAFPVDGGAIMRALSNLLGAVEAEQELIDPTFDLRRTYLASDGMANEDFANAAGALSLQVQGTFPDHAYNEAYEEFVIAFKARFAKEPAPFTSQIFDAVTLLALAVTSAGVDDGPAVRDALFDVSSGGTVFEGRFFGEMASAILLGDDIDYVGPSGELDFDEAGNVTGDYALWQGSVVDNTDPIQYTAPTIDTLPLDDFN